MFSPTPPTCLPSFLFSGGSSTRQSSGKCATLTDYSTYPGPTGIGLLPFQGTAGWRFESFPPDSGASKGAFSCPNGWGR